MKKILLFALALLAMSAKSWADCGCRLNTKEEAIALRSIKSIDGALSRKTDDYLLYFQRGRLYAALEKKEQARQDMATAIQLAADQNAAQLVRTALCIYQFSDQMQDGYYQAAIATLQQIQALGGTFADWPEDRYESLDIALGLQTKKQNEFMFVEQISWEDFHQLVKRFSKQLFAQGRFELLAHAVAFSEVYFPTSGNDEYCGLPVNNTNKLYKIYVDMSRGKVEPALAFFFEQERRYTSLRGYEREQTREVLNTLAPNLATTVPAAFIQALQKHIKQTPVSPYSYAYLSLAYTRQGQDLAAWSAIKTAFEQGLEPIEQFVVHKVTCLANCGLLARAMMELSSEKAQNAAYALLRVRLYAYSGMYDQALIEVERCRYYGYGYDSDYAQAENAEQHDRASAKGNVYMIKGDYSSALQAFQEAHDYSPDDIQTLMRLGTMAWAETNGETTHQAMERVLADSSSRYLHPLALFCLARTEQAQELATQYTPQNVNQYLSLAQYYALSGQIDQAAQAVNKAIDLGFCFLQKLERLFGLDALRTSEHYPAIVERIKEMQQTIKL